MIARGHQVDLLAQDGPMSSRFEETGVRHFKVPPTPFNRLRLISLLRHERYDVVHACTATAGDDAAFALRFVRPQPRFVVSIHTAIMKNVKGNRCLREASEVIAFDRGAMSRLQQIDFLKDRKINLVRRPVEQRARAATAEVPPRIIMVSRLSSSKGPVALAALEAVVALQDEWPGLSLTIVGGGSMLEAIRQRADELNRQFGRKVAEAIGMQVDPFPSTIGASCVVGTAYVALEALFHEIPVVAAGLEAFGVVTPDKLDEAVDCNFGDATLQTGQEINTDLFIKGFRQVLTMLRTPEGREHYRLIRERLEQQHSIERVAEHLEQVYKSAVASRSTP
jgi:glycosyltransferase involved in cell wall biosynthesis